MIQRFVVLNPVLQVPPHLSDLLQRASGPGALVDELLWLGQSELWGEMVGCFLEAGDCALMPEGWVFRFRVVLGRGGLPAVRVSTSL